MRFRKKISISVLQVQQLQFNYCCTYKTKSKRLNDKNIQKFVALFCSYKLQATITKGKPNFGILSFKKPVFVLSYGPMDSVLAFQSEGREFESRQRQVKLYFKIIIKADLYISEYQENSIWKRNMDTILRLWTQFSCSYNLCNQHSKNSIRYRQKLASHLFFHFLFEIQKMEIVFTIKYKIRVQWIQFLSIK